MIKNPLGQRIRRSPLPSRRRSFALAFLAVALLELSAHAAVVDRFQCTVDFEPSEKAPSLHFELPQTVVRTPLESSPLGVGTNYSTGSAKSSVDIFTPEFGRLKVQTSLRYIHALRTPAGGTPEGALWRCVEMNAITPSGEYPVKCIDPHPDPFDFQKGNWVKTGVIQGIPTFSVKQFKLQTTLPEGTILYRCSLIKTEL